jgi:hypothetical protein
MRVSLTTFSLIFIFIASGCQPEPTGDFTMDSNMAPVFTRLSGSETGVDFNNHVEENFTNFFARFQYVYNGGGVAIGDVDGDGLSDLYFTAN